MHQSKIEQAQEKMEELRKELRSQVQEEVRTNVRHRAWRRFFLRIGGCCGIYLLALLTIPLLLGYLVARTGYVPVPWFRTWVAHERSPSRVVAPVPVDGNVLFAERFRTAASPEKRPTQVTVAFTEREVTGFLQQVIAERGSLTSAERTTTQAAIATDHVEFFSRIPAYGGGTTTLRIRGVPAVRDGAFAFDVSEIAVGNLGVPRFVARMIVDALITQIVSANPKSGAAPSALALERIALADGVVQFTFRVTYP